MPCLPVAHKDVKASEVWDHNREEGVGIQFFYGLLVIGKWRRWKGFYKFFIDRKSGPSLRTNSCLRDLGTEPSL